MEPTFFERPSELREWLTLHHDAPELLIGFYKKQSGRPSITYTEALDQVLCFGWIDGVRRSLDTHAYVIRFTPRRRGSVWSEVNIRRVRALIERGLMQPAGLKAFGERDEEKTRQRSYAAHSDPLAEGYQEQFRVNEAAWSFFQAQSPSYQRNASQYVMSARQETTRLKRLQMLITHSAARRRIDFMNPTRS